MAQTIIHIFGPSGSGTTSLGRQMALNWGFRQLDSDDFYWLPTDPPFTSKRPPEQRLEQMEQALAQGGDLVVSGSLCGRGDRLIPSFTLVVRLEVPTELRLQRLRRRESQRFGARVAPGGDMAQAHLEFLRWAAQYDQGGPDMRSKALHDQWQTQLQCPLLVLNGAASLQENLAQVAQSLNDSQRLRP